MAISAIQQSKLWATADYVKYLTGLAGYEKIYNSTDIQENVANALGITTDEFLTLLRSDLVNFAEVYGFTAKEGNKAKGVAQIIFNSASSVSIALGTPFYTVVGERKFLTAEAVQNKAPNLSPDGLYYLNLMFEAEDVGASYNVVGGTNLRPESGLVGFISASFLADITNGTDPETVQEFVDRIRESRQSRGIGSKSFLSNLLTSDPRVYDIAIYSVNDVYQKFQRNYGVDVWAHAEETPKSITETTTGTDHVLAKQPLIDSGAIATAGYSVTRRTTSAWSRSVMAIDYVTGTAGGSVTYYADDTIRQLQLVVQDPDYWLFGGRTLVLLKKALRTLVDIEARVYLHDGYNEATVKASIEDDLQKYFTGGTTSYGKVLSRVVINQDIDKSDLLAIISNNAGVDRVDLTTYVAQRQDGLYPITDPIPIEYNEFAYLGDVTITTSDLRYEAP